MKPVVTISGSYRKHFERLLAAKAAFEQLGVTVLRPHSERISSSSDEIVRLEGDPEDADGIQNAQLDAIRRSRLVYVVNPGGYVGPSTMLEVGYALGLGIPVILSEQAFEQSAAIAASRVGDVGVAYGLLHDLASSDDER